jgi:hypothetical protein
MAHLVIDTLILHELQLHIPAQTILERLPEWIATVVTARSRSARIQGMAHFCGIELIEYDSAVDNKDRDGNWFVHARSSQWLLRQPA